MLYENQKKWLDAMKEHHCEKKELLPADDPSNDIWSAKVEGREPTRYPRRGFVCQGCGEVFEINLKDMFKFKSEHK